MLSTIQTHDLFITRCALYCCATTAAHNLVTDEKSCCSCPGLLSLLKWKSEPDRLAKNLQIFNQKVNGNELVKFMPDVLDALFSILVSLVSAVFPLLT